MPTSDEIIQKLRANPDAYKDAAKREGEVWGGIFTSEKMGAVRETARIAAERLRVGRNNKGLPAIARAEKWHFKRGLSLACGSGRAERHLMRLGICESFVGVDVSENAIAEARVLAEKEQREIRYEVGDLNTMDLGVEQYDLVVTQTCLHHIVELERLADQIWNCLLPGGRLWIDDFVGETQFQWLDKRLEIANAILEILPERYRVSRVHGRKVDKIQRRAPGNLASPFEAIRSGEIIPVFASRFDIELRNERNAIMYLLTSAEYLPNYLETEEGPVIYELLMLLDGLLVENAILPPLTGQYVMRKPLAG